jgi:hypothetical protein
LFRLRPKENIMKKLHIAAIGFAALLLTGVGVGGATAVSSVPTPAPTSATDTEVADATETPGATDPTEAPGAPESTTPDDGNDGGHADPAGVDVNNEGSATEK